MSSIPDLYASVTQRIIEALEAGTPPWQCTWRGVGADARPAYAVSRRPYRGINVLLLKAREEVRVTVVG